MISLLVNEWSQVKSRRRNMRIIVAWIIGFLKNGQREMSGKNSITEHALVGSTLM